jgi:thioesterase domain-containing protein
LKQIWESVLGADGIAPGDDLFDEWGATSAHAMLACAEMEAALDVALALPDVLVLPTIVAQAHALIGEAGAAIPTVARVRGGDGLPIVFLPPGGGLGYSYLPLVRRLEGGHPIFLAQTPELRSGPDTLLGIDELAEAYARALAAEVDARAYVLAGWSFGAVLAYETALALDREGRPVLALLLFDPPMPGRAPARGAAITDDMPVLSKFGRLLDPYRADTSALLEIDRSIFPDLPSVAASSRGDVWASLLERLLEHSTENERNHFLIPELSPPDVLHVARIWKKNFALMDEYEPSEPCGGHAFLFVGPTTSDSHVLARVLTEPTVFRYEFQSVAELPPHAAVMEPENVALFADDLNASLARTAPVAA